jgi:hypothetical protein
MDGMWHSEILIQKSKKTPAKTRVIFVQFSLKSAKLRYNNYKKEKG